MRNLSTEFKEQQNSGNRNYLKYADFTFTDGSTLSITDKDLWSNGFKFEDAVSQSGSFDIGAAIVNKLTLQINNFSGKYTDYIWDGARVVCHIGLELSTGIEKIRICTMTVTDAPYQNTAIISLNCEDSMRKFDRDYSESKLTYPATRLQIIQDACEVCGVTLQSTRFDNDDFVIQNRPNDNSITFRQVIAWVAQMGCQWAKSDEYGRLCLGWYESEVPDKFYNLVETPWKDTDGNDILDTTGAQIITIMQKGITSTDTNGFTPWLYDIEITGVKVTEYVDNYSQNEAKTYQSGKSGYVIEIIDNKLIQEGTGGTICQIIADRCVGMKFRPFTTGALTNIAWEAGDTIAISDRNGKQYKSYLTSVTLNPGVFEQLECSAKSVSRNKQKQYSLNQQVQAENKKNLRDERTAREKAIEDLSNRLAESPGVYTTVEPQLDGSNIYYLHNKPNLADSNIIWKMTAEAWAVSTDGGQHWNGGMTVDGDVIARILTATGVNADWINTGTIKAIDKDGNITFMVDIVTGRVVINADSVQIKGKDIDIIAKEKAETEVNNFISNTYTTDINNLQSQIDGQIETFFYDYEPTLQNIPASGWTTKEERKKHEGDLFYWKSKGYAYRFMQDGATWKWQLVQDTDITLALAAAEKAQDTADHKRRVFVVQPEPPYDIGDLWTQGKNGDLMRCRVARASGSYSEDDWEKASKYTDDSTFNTFLDGVFKDTISNLKTQIDGKIETWYQPNDPSLKWTKTEEYPWCDIDGNKILDESGNEIVLVWESEKAEHEGDLWHNTSDNTQWIYKSGEWQPQSIPDELLDKIDGKSSVYMVQPKPPYYKGDLWVTTNSEGKASLKTSTVNRVSGDFDASDWIDFKYADKDDIKKAIDNYDTSLGQDKVFNKLTKGGAEQGIYIEDGKVYINAKYILAGLLAGERINGRGLKVIDDSKNVTLEIDSKGNVILAPKTFSLQGKTVKEIADSSASTAVSGQTQADIFSKLTNGGKAQGIYLDENGNVYVNGEYVQAKGIRVVDSNGKTTFSIDKETGAVTILASSFLLGDKSIADIAQEKVNGQTQNDIFNKLTSNGAIKGLYMKDGQIYFSFSYAQGGTLKLGGENNGLGSLEILDAKGKSVAEIDNTSITIYTSYTDDKNWNAFCIDLGTENTQFRRKVNGSLYVDTIPFETVFANNKLYLDLLIYNLVANGVINVTKSDLSEAQVNVSNSSISGRLVSSANKNFGLYHITFSKWLIRMGEDGNAYLPDTIFKGTATFNESTKFDGTATFDKGTIFNGTASFSKTTTFDETASFQKAPKLYNLTHVTTGGHLVMGSDGASIAYLGSSSLRYKDVQRAVEETDLESLYQIKVVWAKYKNEYLDASDERYGKEMPMFLAEDIDQHFPLAVDHDEQDRAENWNYRIMIPCMFAMLKNEHDKVVEVKKENEHLKSELQSIKEGLAEIKQLLSKSV
nr:MAG TPA: Putative tail protein [Caudoviricetes sp.]